MAAPYINPIPRLAFPEASPRMQQHLNLLVDTVNSLAGHNGTIQLNNHLSLAGNTIQNVGAAQNDDDVVTQAFAQSNYSASALRPQLEANGSNPMVTMRRINDSTQREQTSTWLNRVMSTPPNASAAQVLFSTSGGTTTITVNATTLTRADGSTQPLAGYSFPKSNPTSYSIVSISRTAGTVTAVFASPPGLSAGAQVGVSGVTDSSFDGSFVLTGVSGVDLIWKQSLTNASSTGGSLSTAGVYYIYAIPNNPQMFVAGGYGADTPQNRINASNDQKQIIAVAVLNGSGGVNSQSGGGGTPTTGDIAGGSFF